MNRRDLLKLAGTGIAAAAADTLLARDHPPMEPAASGLGVLVDTTVCVGCRKCEWACDNSNALTTLDQKAYEDKSVFKTDRRPTESAFTIVNSFDDPRAPENQKYIKIQCMHCLRPACVSACLVGALQKSPNGPVVYDAWRCMGCRYCMVACPFQIPAYEYAKPLTPRVMKCGFCADRIKEGKKPACVEICPNESLTFGPRHDLIDLAHSKIRQSPERYHDKVYGLHEVGGTSWLYLAGIDLAQKELPKLPDQAAPDVTEPIQHGIFKYFIPPVALYSILGLSMISLRKRDGDDDEEDRHVA